MILMRAEIAFHDTGTSACSKALYWDSEKILDSISQYKGSMIT